ncbi:hypothetical protein [Litorimonas sp.]|uniref:hypothetical protein n=1 Tax=Litorimonas sp. TaxID=1892381 RepID=UPI003A86CD5E
MITEQKLVEALRILADPDGTYANTRAGHEFSQKMEKIVLANLVANSPEKSAAASEKWAMRQPEYTEAIEQTRECAELDYRIRAKREAAMIIVETWRTEQSNERAHTRTSNVRAA